MIDYHIHLERGNYTEAWLKEFIDVGHGRGIKEFGIVEHLYLFKEASELLYKNKHVTSMQTRNIADYFKFLTEMKDKYNLKIGIEVDYVEEFEEEIRDFIKDLPVDFLIGSVHYLGEWAFDLNRDWQGRDINDVYKKYYDTLMKAVDSDMFDIIGHPGNIEYFGYKPSSEVEDDLVRNFYNKLAKTDIVVEINSGGLYRPAGIVFPELKWLKTLNELNIEVTCSSDAHDPIHTGWEIQKKIIPALKESGYNQIVTFEKRNKGYRLI